MRARILLAVTIATLPVWSACAADWRYCLATSADQKTIYVSDIFESASALDRLQGQFADELAQKHYKASGIQCPRGGRSDDIRSAIAELQSYQRNLGNRVAHIDWSGD